MTAGFSGLWATALAGSPVALAARPCGSRGVFSQSGQTATCTYTTQATEGTFLVPAGVRTLRVTAIGAPGGGTGGGLGASVVNTALPVPSRASKLYVDVGAGGSGGGGGGSFDGGGGGAGGGGGSSAILTVPRATATLTGNPLTDSRLLVAGAGGGSGGGGVGGSAGDTSVTGAGAGGCGGAGAHGGVGPTDGSNGGGSGCGGSGDGSASSGGTGAVDGGGGGGGWFGGGGGGPFADGGGGGGGSSYGGAGPSAGITITTASATATPKVVISWVSQNDNSQGDNNNQGQNN